MCEKIGVWKNAPHSQAAQEYMRRKKTSRVKKMTRAKNGPTSWRWKDVLVWIWGSTIFFLKKIYISGSSLYICFWIYSSCWNMLFFSRPWKNNKLLTTFFFNCVGVKMVTQFKPSWFDICSKKIQLFWRHGAAGQNIWVRLFKFFCMSLDRLEKSGGCSVWKNNTCEKKGPTSPGLKDVLPVGLFLKCISQIYRYIYFVIPRTCWNR